MTYECTQFDTHLISNILTHLFEKNIQSVIIEGGTFTLQQFINKNLWDEARIFIAETKIFEGIKRPDFNFIPVKTIKIKNNQLKTYINYD